LHEEAHSYLTGGVDRYVNCRLRQAAGPCPIFALS
jgi:hypothetical protein